MNSQNKNKNINIKKPNVNNINKPFINNVNNLPKHLFKAKPINNLNIFKRAKPILNRNWKFLNNNRTYNNDNSNNQMAVQKQNLTNFKNNNNNNNNNNNRFYRRNNNKGRIYYLANPMVALLENRLFSIFSSDEKVIRMSLLSTASINVNSELNVIWLPNSVGFSENFKYLQCLNMSGTVVYTKFYSNLLYATQSNLSSKSFFCSEMNTCQIYGKYRLIGSELKITNVTNVTNKGGYYISARATLDNLFQPVYYAVRGIALGPPGQEDFSIYSDTFNINVDNQPNKLLSSSTDITYLKFINNTQNLVLFNNYDEYVQTPYNRNDPGWFFSKLTNVDKRGSIGNNVIYKIKFANPPHTQDYLFEEYSIFEIIPDPQTNLGGLAVDSFAELSKNQNRILNSTILMHK